MAAIESISFKILQAKVSVHESAPFGNLPLVKELADRIIFVRKRVLGLNQAELADRLGVSRGAVGNWELKGNIKRDNIAKLADISGVSMDWLSHGRGSAPLPAPLELRSEQQTIKTPLKLATESQPLFNPPPEILGERDLPVFSAVEGGPGEMVVDNEPFDYVTRPWYVRNVDAAYAVLVVGDSMTPEFKPGRMAIVNPKLPLVPGEPAIFVNREHGGFKATIKELVRSTATHWVVKQHNPPEGEKPEFKLKRTEWPEAFRVVGSYYR